MRYFYLFLWLLLSALVAIYMWPKSANTVVTPSNNVDEIVVIDEVDGSSYTQSEDGNSSAETTTSNETEADATTKDDQADFRKEGKAKSSFLEKAYIEFGQNKVTLPKNPEFDQYLDSIAALVKSEGYSINLVGHTDSSLSKKQDNYQVGLSRANHIKELLTQRGIDASKISVDSKADQEPRIEGNSPKARKKNRRVELFLKPN